MPPLIPAVLAAAGSAAGAAAGIAGATVAGISVSPTAPLRVHPQSDDFDVERDGLGIMRAQRGFVQAGHPAVGGFVQLTSVFRDRIETRILERWH